MSTQKTDTITLDTFSATLVQLHRQRITDINNTIENAIAAVHAECLSKKLTSLQPISIPLLPPSSDTSTIPLLLDFLNHKVNQLTTRGFSAAVSVPTSNPYSPSAAPGAFAMVRISFPINATTLQELNASFFQDI